MSQRNNCLPQKKSTTKPFTKKQVENVLQGVLAGYNRYSATRQHGVSVLVLKMQDLMTIDASETTLVKGPSGAHMLAPNSLALKREPRNRLKPIHEHLVQKRSNKYSLIIQNQGVEQTLSGNDSHIVVHGKLKRTCQFCTGTHGYNECDKLDGLTLNAMIYRLSSATPDITRSSKERIQYAMPVQIEMVTVTPFGVIHNIGYSRTVH